MRSITNFLGASEAFRLRTMVESSLQYFSLDIIDLEVCIHIIDI